jgi:preprotein translocase subunit Sec63
MCGIVAGDSAAAKKKKLRVALMRWHPDKFTKIVNRVQEGDRGEVLEAVKAVTRRILEEKKKHDA